MRLTLLLITLLVSFSLVAQMSVERYALRNINKGKWQRSQNILLKALYKDTANATTTYVYARYFIAPKNPHYNIDSAYQYTLKTSVNFTHSNARLRQRMKRLPLDSVIISTLREQIDSAAFKRAKDLNTEKDYQYFLSVFINAKQEQQVLELRNEAAYQQALKQNTHLSFLQFLRKYPQAVQANEAQIQYERLLFEHKTQDKRLASYEYFLKEHPSSRYSKTAEKNIFEILTASGDVSSFELFLQKYPNSFFICKAKDILFHLFSEDGTVELPSYLHNDSIKNVMALNQTYLVPLINGGKIIFINNEGVEIIKTDDNEINKEYKCGNVTADFLQLKRSIISKDNKTIFSGVIDNVDDLGYGFLKVQSDHKIFVLHKSGFSINEDDIQDAKIIDGKFLAIQRSGLWAPWTLTGKKLMTYNWDDITTTAHVVVFKKSGKYKLATINQVAQLADQRNLKTLDLFDDVKPLQKNFIWARTGDYEGVLDQWLNYIVPFEKHKLISASHGFVTSGTSGINIYNQKANVSEVFDDVKVNPLWVSVRNKNNWLLYNINNHTYLSEPYDSVTFTGTFAIGHIADTLDVYFQPHLNQKFNNASVDYIQGKDSTSFLLVTENKIKCVYNDNGVKLFTNTCDKALYAGQGIFVITKNKKKGLINKDGKVLLPVEYDAIGGLNGQTISVLKNMKFGLFDIGKRKLIKPQYDKNLNLYNEKLLIGFKTGFYGFTKWNDKPVSEFLFEEIIFWTDTVALVKKNTKWMLYHIMNQKILLEDIKDYRLFNSNNGEKILIIQQQNYFGVISNMSGIIIPVAYTNVKNVGSPEKPIYFTVKHEEEAPTFEVAYYNHKGILLHQQVFEEDDFENVYCND